ncbi:Cation/calcium exchanger 1 [Forsythia ovata]
MANERPISTDQKGKTLLYILELPLYLPRRLTIPLVSQEKWCKPFAVLSITLDPLLFALIWGFNTKNPQILIYAIGGSSIGIALGILAFYTTHRLSPPRKYLFLWLALGFLMSIIWTYILAQELISLMVSIGLILGLNHSILGLTVLAWGNSLGDLVSNVTVAKNGGPDGVQLAIFGCYAGPIFNTLVGLGLSLTFSTWAKYPDSCAIQVEDSVYETIGFLIVGLLWALVILPQRKMRLDRFVGSGLLAIYSCFLSSKIARNLGLVQFHMSPSYFMLHGG